MKRVFSIFSTEVDRRRQKTMVCPLCGSENVNEDYCLCRECDEFVELEKVERDGLLKMMASAVERFLEMLISESQEKVFSQFFAVMAALAVVAAIIEGAAHTLVLAGLFALLSLMTWKCGKKVKME